MPFTQQDAPLITICVPTHHGRRAAVSALLEGVIEQARAVPGLVEVCVSDNASCDGTEERVAELSRSAPCRVTYRRQPTDVGLARNLLAAVELARGRYCWLLGSDDLLADGALKRVREILDKLPNATGYVVGAIHVDADDPALRSRQLPREFHPPGEDSRLIEGLDAVYDQCGNAWCALSWSLVDRQAWLRAARDQMDVVLAHPVFPQVVILAAMAARRPCWGWLAEPLVRQRNATTFLFEQGQVSQADRWSQILSGVASAWRAVLGRPGNARWRRRMRLLHRVWGKAEDMRATHLYDKPTVRSQARLALVCLGAFWPVRAYWREVLPATLMPVWLTRARYGPEGGWLAGTRGPQPDQLALSAPLPSRLRAASAARVDVVIRNGDRRRAAPCAGPHAVRIGLRWSTPDGRPVGPKELGLNWLAALPQSLPRPVRAGRALRVEMVLHAPREPGSYCFELVAHQQGRGCLDEAGHTPALAGTVEVIGRCEMTGETVTA